MFTVFKCLDCVFVTARSVCVFYGISYLSRVSQMSSIFVTNVTDWSHGRCWGFIHVEAVFEITDFSTRCEFHMDNCTRLENERYYDHDVILSENWLIKYTNKFISYNRISPEKSNARISPNKPSGSAKDGLDLQWVRNELFNLLGGLFCESIMAFQPLC